MLMTSKEADSWTNSNPLRGSKDLVDIIHGFHNNDKGHELSVAKVC